MIGTFFADIAAGPKLGRCARSLPISFTMRSGCVWRLLSSNLPPWSTIYSWFAKSQDEDRFAKVINLVMLDRERMAR